MRVILRSNVTAVGASPSAKIPLSSCKRGRTSRLARTEFFGDQAREAWQINEIEGIVLAGEHCDSGLLEPADMIPSLLERDRVILRYRREDQIDEEAQPANQFVFMRYQRRYPFVGHRG